MYNEQWIMDIEQRIMKKEHLEISNKQWTMIKKPCAMNNEQWTTNHESWTN